jgi:phage tail-like protein
MTMATQAASSTAGGRTDPYRAFNFKIEIQGVTEGHFAECSGLGMKISVLSYREGGNNQITHRIPGAVDHASVTLRAGLTRSTELWDWMQKIAKGNIERRNVSIVMLDSDGSTEVLRWNLLNAWPSEWYGAPLNAAGDGLAIETITLVFESLERG